MTLERVADLASEDMGSNPTSVYRLCGRLSNHISPHKLHLFMGTMSPTVLFSPRDAVVIAEDQVDLRL